MFSAVRSPRVAMSAALLSLAYVGVAQAGDCNSDVAALSQKRQAVMEKLNTIAKATKGKLDPIASCPVLRTLVKTEGDLLSYLNANKNWCNVPDDAITNLQTADVKTRTFATQACNFAEQARKAQKQAASNASIGTQAQKLPTGPL